jgi:hypothetical protein
MDELEVLQKQFEDLPDKFQTACGLLCESAEDLGRIDYPDVNFPQGSIMQCPEENL